MPRGRQVGVFPGTVAIALMSACTTAPPRSAEQIRADESLAEHVSAALDADPIYFYRHVDVRVDEGVTDLSGYVWSTDAIYRARQIARQVPGVKRVVTNNLELERAGLSRGPSR
jgi:osmotically-inducible protein OsmY